MMHQIRRSEPIFAFSFVLLLLLNQSSAAPIDGSDLDVPLEETELQVGPREEGGENSDEEVPANPIAAAQQAFNQRQIPKCLEHLRLAVAERPNLPPPNLILADFFLRTEQKTAGRQLLEKVALEDPTHPELYRLFGGLALAERRWTEGKMAFDKALSLPAPANWTEKQKAHFSLSCQRGLTKIAERRGDWAGASEMLSQLVQHAAKDAALRDRWATALCREGQFDKAYEQYQLAHVYDDTMMLPELSMGISLVQQGRYKDADGWFARAVRAHPADADARFQIAVALLVQDRAKESAAHAAAAANLGMATSPLKMIQGQAARQLGEQAAAEKIFRELVGDSSTNTDAQLQLALVLADQDAPEKLAEALEIVRTLAGSQPGSPRVQATLGWVLHRQGKQEEAEPLLRKAATAANIDAESLYHVGRFFEAQGKADEAKAVAIVAAERIAATGVIALRPKMQAWVQKVLAE